jgi:chitin synthase
MNSQVDVELFSNTADMNSLYEEALENLRERKPVQDPKNKNRVQTDAEGEQAAKDYYASVRTNVLMAWVLSNVSAMTWCCFVVL